MSLKTYTEFAQLRRAAESLQSEVWAMIKDTNIPLAERWMVFKESAGKIINKRNSSYMDFKSMNDAGFNGSWYDEFYLDRHQTMELSNLVGTLEERLEEKPWTKSNGWRMTREQIELLKEEILQSGYTAFEFDW